MSKIRSARIPDILYEQELVWWLKKSLLSISKSVIQKIKLNILLKMKLKLFFTTSFEKLEQKFKRVTKHIQFFL